MPFRLCALWGVLLTLLSASPVWAGGQATPSEPQIADDEEPSEIEQEDPKEHRRPGERHFRLGVKGSYALKLVSESSKSFNLYGGALSFEGMIVPQVFAIELEVRGLVPEADFILPIDLMLKWPPRLTEKLHLDLGIGTTFEFEFRDQVVFNFGLATLVGISYWFVPRIAFIADFNYGVVFSEPAAHEFNVNAGVAFAF